MISYSFWQREFDGQSSAVGRSITIEGETIRRVGPVNPEFPLDLDLGDVAILPGFVNAHTHLELGPIPWDEAAGPENEVAWLPFVIDQMDYYYQRFQSRTPIALSRLPSQCFADQVHATFFRDPNVAIVVDRFGAGNVLWSSDYPHGNSTWPDSQKVVAEKLGRLEPSLLEQVTSTNCKSLYRM